MYKFLIVILLICQAMVVNAQLPQYEGSFDESQSLQEYFDAENQNYDKSIIYVFFNNNDCYGCPQAMNMIEELYHKDYSDKYNLFMINYEEDDEYNFISTYDLSKPLEMVLVRIQDGAVFGYEKIENLQNMISDQSSFNDYVKGRIESFLGHNG